MGSPFRTTYRDLTEAEKRRLQEIKEAADYLYLLMSHPFDGVGEVPKGGREFATARTHLETAVMWAVKGVTG